MTKLTTWLKGIFITTVFVLCLLFALSFLSSPIRYVDRPTDSIIIVKKDSVLKVIPKKKKIVVDHSQLFLKNIAKQESGNNYRIVSKNGMIGKYQFSKNTLKMMNINRDSFLLNEQLQDSVMIKLLRLNYNILKPYIKQYSGTTKDGIQISVSGILAGAHLMGPGGVMSWLKNDSTYQTSDSNGMHISTYMSRFGNFNIYNILKRKQ